ncbi:MAG: TetR/AcrR family transcriptional regulator [Gammaproteobacteria bacterium]
MNRQEQPPARGAHPGPRALALLPMIEEIILHEGFSRLSVSELAERLCCSKRTLYELAPSKNELVLRILNAFFLRIRTDASTAAAAQSSSQQGLHDYLQVGVRAAQRLSQVTVTDIQQWAPALEVWRDHVRLRVQGFCVLLEQGIRAGEFRNVRPVLVAEIVFASLSRILQPEFYSTTRISISEAFHEYYALLMAAITDEHPQR